MKELDAEGGLSVPREMQRGRFKRFVDVMANITDCRSVAMSSILIRTAITSDKNSQVRIVQIN